MTQPSENRVRRASEPYRDFDPPEPAPRTTGPVFKLGGQEFHCVGKLSGATLLLLGRIVGTDDRGRAVRDPAILEFMEGVLADELPVFRPVEGNGEAGEPGAEVEVWEPCDDVARWNELMHNKRRPVEADELGKIVSWLIEEFTGRPTRPSER